jgi:DNA-binding NarL/FixJ family response regulator
MARTRTDRIDVLIGDRHPLVCEGLAAVLGREPDMAVVDMVSGHEDLMTTVHAQAPDVVVVGHEPPAMDGFRITRELSSGILSILLFDAAGTDDLREALSAGARGLLYKDQAPEVLPSAIRNVLSDATVIVSKVALDLICRPAIGPEGCRTEEISKLTRRETEVLRYVAHGLNNRQIADRLSLSIATIKSHLYSACRKLGLRDRTQAAVMAYKSGLICRDSINCCDSIPGAPSCPSGRGSEQGWYSRVDQGRPGLKN